MYLDCCLVYTVDFVSTIGFVHTIYLVCTKFVVCTKHVVKSIINSSLKCDMLLISVFSLFLMHFCKCRFHLSVNQRGYEEK